MIHPCKFPREFIHSVPDDYHLIITVTKMEDYVTPRQIVHWSFDHDDHPPDGRIARYGSPCPHPLLLHSQLHNPVDGHRSRACGCQNSGDNGNDDVDDDDDDDDDGDANDDFQ